MKQPTSEQLALFEELHQSRKRDYETFRKKSYRGIWSGVIDKYPESAHFIYELLQNADDAEATWVEVDINPYRLMFKHNGLKHFNITKEEAEPVGDINSITSIGDSSKNQLDNKIGKFGVGFKAVFQYTAIPEIYDDTFKFKIENYIIPTLLESDHPNRKEGETLFVLPFKDDSAFEVIVKRLRDLQNPLLFLRNLSKIDIRVSDFPEHKAISYGKELVDSINCDRNVRLNRYILKEPKGERTILLFSKNISIH